MNGLTNERKRRMRMGQMEEDEDGTDGRGYQ